MHTTFMDALIRCGWTDSQSGQECVLINDHENYVPLIQQALKILRDANTAAPNAGAFRGNKDVIYVFNAFDHVFKYVHHPSPWLGRGYTRITQLDQGLSERAHFSTKQDPKMTANRRLKQVLSRLQRVQADANVPTPEMPEDTTMEIAEELTTDAVKDAVIDSVESKNTPARRRR